jgi:hypothetical protein
MTASIRTPAAQRAYDECHARGVYLVNYWKRRGHTVTVEVVPTETPVDGHDVALFTLKSDMVNGLPRSLAEGPGAGEDGKLTIRRRRADEGGGLFHY